MVSLDPTGTPPEVSVGLPQPFGRYVLFDRIGQGGMAEIFLALADSGLGGGKRAVVKRILPGLSADPAFADMLVREAKLSARLSHRNIVQVTDLGRAAGQLYIAMEYVEGYDLNRLLRRLSERRVALPAEFALFMVREVLTALDYAHRATDDRGLPLGVVHRDVSPSNVLISFEGEVSLCDFGIARALGPGAEPGSGVRRAVAEQPEARGRVAGKSAYMAPEQAVGDEVDLRSDVFAAGILLWELCAGRRMYRGTEEEMLAQARAAEVPTLPDRGLPQQELLQYILDRALSADPALRFQSAGQMMEALDEYGYSAGLVASQLRFSTFLQDNFAAEIVDVRRDREQAAQAQRLALSAELASPAEPPSPNADDSLGAETPTGLPSFVDEPLARRKTMSWPFIACAALVLGAALAVLFSIR